VLADWLDAAMIREGERNKIFTILIITAERPKAKFLPDAKIAKKPLSPAMNTPIIGMKMATVDNTNADIPNAFVDRIPFFYLRYNAAINCGFVVDFFCGGVALNHKKQRKSRPFDGIVTFFYICL
jgi:hypothetical protein